MRAIQRLLPTTLAVVAAAASVLAPALAHAQTFALDPMSASLPAILAGPADLLTGAGPPAFGPLPPPVVGLSTADLHLLPGDVIDALSIGDDAAPGTLYFTVSRGSASAGPGPIPKDVFTEFTGVPVLTQPDASGDIFSTGDPTCGVFFGANTQTLDGNGLIAGPPPPTCYPGFGLGLTEGLPLGPPLNDQIADFDWALPGRIRLFCAFLSLAPGSPTLTPGANPSLPLGAEPGDILVSCPVPSSFLGITIPALANGLVSGGPGCAPPLCDDIDAITMFGFPLFSLAPGSPTLTTLLASPADLFGMFSGAPPPPIVLPAGALGLAPGDDVKGLELLSNPCPVFPCSPPDADCDGVDNFCGTPDNCPAVVNPGQEDSDFDGSGDSCDTCTDTDGDLFGDPGFPANLCATDNCPFLPNPQVDTDADGVGNDCDNCPAVANSSQADGDFDSFGDTCDNCPALPNFPQTDGDSDGIGNDCDICTNVGGAQTITLKPTVKLSKMALNPSPDVIVFSGEFILAGATNFAMLDPLTDGSRIVIQNVLGGTEIDVTLPPGAFVPGGTGWASKGLPITKWTWLDKSASPGSLTGIISMTIEDKNSKFPNRVKFKVKGKGGPISPYPVVIADAPLNGLVVFGGQPSSDAGECGETFLTAPNCKIKPDGSSVVCKY